MDIQDIRRANLKRWLETNSTPPKEKSLFSQLKGTGSFGERVARRLEHDYGMGDGFLDSEPSGKPSNTGQKHPLSPEAQSLIRCVERLDSSGPEFAQMFAHHARLLTLAGHLAGMQDADVGRELRIEEQKLTAHIDQVRGHHARERKTK